MLRFPGVAFADWQPIVREDASGFSLVIRAPAEKRLDRFDLQFGCGKHFRNFFEKGSGDFGGSFEIKLRRPSHNRRLMRHRL